MPIYVYRCLDCGLSHEIRHGFDETYDGVCDTCKGVVRKYFGEVHISASATPTRGMHDGKAIDWGGSKAKERDKYMVVMFIDPEATKDSKTKNVKEITIQFTFFDYIEYKKNES